MNEFNWKAIRTFEGSQNTAFEELVCQLAREEEISGKVRFTRVAAPDAGVEAYCSLQNGTEYGWQAKFFHNMGESQWNQIENSFTTALEKHPKLVQSYICIPLDRQDPRMDKHEWFMDKWNSKSATWEAFARTKSREIHIEYWGSSELIHRLSIEKNSGRKYFWFGGSEFSSDWFKTKLDRSIDALGERYTPRLNFQLDIAKVFDGIAYDDHLRAHFAGIYDDLLKKINRATKSLNDENFTSDETKVQFISTDIKSEFNRVDFTAVDQIPWERFRKILHDLEAVTDDCERTIHDLRDKATAKGREESQVVKYGTLLSTLYALRGSCHSFVNFTTSSTADLTNKPVLVLVTMLQRS
jgi:hypothetical protein